MDNSEIRNPKSTSEDKVSILMVDDRPENLLALESILSNLGEHLVKANSGEDALRFLLKQEFALILLDVQMPGMDGFETAAFIRQREQSKYTPIIFLTAIGKSDTFIFKGYSTGAVDYIIKPIVPEILKAKVKVFVDMFRMKQELKRHLEETSRLNREIEAANKELESFSYSVSHDLRAPLRGIRGFARILLEDCADKLDEQGKDCLGRIQEAIRRMGDLIDALLTLSRITRSEINRKLVDLSALAQTIARELQENEPGRQVEFVIAKGLSANGDPRLLRSVLDNLFTNAWKFTGKRPQGQIEFGVTQDNGQTVFFVRDNGAGFDMAYADKLFGPFQRLHSIAEFPGIGIGLATVMRIIYRHGGRVWAEGGVEKGATFYFTL